MKQRVSDIGRTNHKRWTCFFAGYYGNKYIYTYIFKLYIYMYICWSITTNYILNGVIKQQTYVRGLTLHIFAIRAGPWPFTLRLTEGSQSLRLWFAEVLEWPSMLRNGQIWADDAAHPGQASPMDHGKLFCSHGFSWAVVCFYRVFSWIISPIFIYPMFGFSWNGMEDNKAYIYIHHLLTVAHLRGFMGI